MEPNKKVAASRDPRTSKRRKGCAQTSQQAKKRIHLTNIKVIVARLEAWDETQREQARQGFAANPYGPSGRWPAARYRGEAQFQPKAPCAVCQSVKHFTAECPVQSTPHEGSDRPAEDPSLGAEAPTTQVPCAVCESVEHLTSECTIQLTPHEGSDRRAENPSLRSVAPSTEDRCAVCESVEHSTGECTAELTHTRHRALLHLLNTEASQLYKAHYPHHWPPVLDETADHS